MFVTFVQVINEAISRPLCRVACGRVLNARVLRCVVDVTKELDVECDVMASTHTTLRNEWVSFRTIS